MASFQWSDWCRRIECLGLEFNPQPGRSHTCDLSTVSNREDFSSNSYFWSLYREIISEEKIKPFHYKTYFIIKLDTGYPHDGRADNAAYRHDRRADKRRYPHDREIDIQMLRMFRNGYMLS